MRGQGRAAGRGLFSKACPTAGLSCEGVQHEAWAGEQVLCTAPQKADLHKQNIAMWRHATQASKMSLLDLYFGKTVSHTEAVAIPQLLQLLAQN